MIVNKLLEFVFSAPSNISILRTLNERNVGISGREASRLTGLSLRTVQVSLSNLEKAGIIKRISGKREHLFLIDRSKFLSKKLVEEIFRTESDFIIEIIKQIRQNLKKYCKSAILFGSTARGDENIESDFDLCIVYDNNLKLIENNVSKLRSMLYESFNITLAPFYISTSKFKKMGLQKKAPINKIIKEGRVISGLSIKEILYG